MKENKSIVGLILSADNKKEAEDILSFTKTLTADQAKEFDALLRGVKIGLDLATGGAVKTA
ncbi:hypothetical protein DWY36_02600 [Firmicutes bacterium AF25-13AC]|nr:hypothetical protein DWY36_02600 [Firmicutes bacterium AF25-13AC]